VNFKEYIPVCPTSAMSGDGMGDLMTLLTNCMPETSASTIAVLRGFGMPCMYLR
jgi:hypothetical protein